MKRRDFIKLGTTLPVATAFGALPDLAWPQQKRFAPRPGQWRAYEVTTQVEILKPAGVTKVWLPVPAINSDYQRSLDNKWSAPGGQARLVEDGKYGAKILAIEFPAGVAKPSVELVSRVQIQDRAVDWGKRAAAKENPAALKLWLQPTDLMPIDGIVRRTAEDAIKGKRGDRDKAQALFDWVVNNTHREPKTRGCGVGDIKAMLESGNLYGKCADLNALFVGLARAVGIPARDVYGVRLAPSAFGYKALSANSANISRAQHCRAEVYLADQGWSAMDPADVAKVMREETSDWIKSAAHPLVAAVKQGLFGSWEGNWLAFNLAHDVALPGAKGPKIGFFMYPNAETENERLDSLDPDNFKYVMSAREIKQA
ncbi:MAG: transglutaminase family protein [Burkholderiales bacterium]|nr:transglutaminase family protein [Burkholderiales bacterium]